MEHLSIRCVAVDIKVQRFRLILRLDGWRTWRWFGIAHTSDSESGLIYQEGMTGWRRQRALFALLLSSCFVSS
jgi:hypothetical protein